MTSSLYAMLPVAAISNQPVRSSLPKPPVSRQPQTPHEDFPVLVGTIPSIKPTAAAAMPRSRRHHIMGSHTQVDRPMDRRACAWMAGHLCEGRTFKLHATCSARTGCITGIACAACPGISHVSSTQHVCFAGQGPDSRVSRLVRTTCLTPACLGTCRAHTPQGESRAAGLTITHRQVSAVALKARARMFQRFGLAVSTQ